jgi:O-antigen/teichoic acid export membrane protein
MIATVPFAFSPIVPPNRFLANFLRWRPGRVARNTAHAATWNLVRVVVQALSLVLLTRLLGVKGYGAIAGSVALFMTCGQFTGAGSGIELVRHVARGGELRSRLGATEHVYLLSGLLLFALMWPLSVGLLGMFISPIALACLAATELLIAPALQPMVFRYLAEERTFWSSLIGTLAPLARLVATATAAEFGLRDVSSFAQIYLAWMMVITAITLYLAWPRGDNVNSTPLVGVAIREGLPYAVSSVALTAGSELDKTFLLRLAGDAVTGPYAAAYRIVTAATLPVNALILAASPHLFQAPSVKTNRLVGVMLATVLSYASAAATLLWLLAPLTPLLLGEGFTTAEPLLRGLCVVLVTGSLRQFVTALLTTQDLQKSRNLIEIAGVCTSLVLLALLVPRFSAYGAIAAVACGDFCVLSAGAFVLGWRGLRIQPGTRQ